MMRWVIRPWRQAFDFSGRATRREYWLFLVQLYVLLFLGMFLVAFAAGPSGTPDETLGAGVIAVILVFLLFIIPYLSASVRRLHDHDKSGWLYLLTCVPLVGWIFFLIMMLTPGTPGENSYGHDPREGDRLDTDEVYAIFS